MTSVFWPVNAQYLFSNRENKHVHFPWTRYNEPMMKRDNLSSSYLMEDNMYTLSDIYKDFKNSNNKVEFLKQLQSLNLPYQINYDNLIKFWSTKSK